MAAETSSLFTQVIQDHLELKEQNAGLDRELPLERYKNADPFKNHPLFKTEEQARIEDTMDGTEPAIPTEPAIALKWPGEDDLPETDEVDEQPVESHALWTRSRDFDWGD